MTQKKITAPKVATGRSIGANLKITKQLIRKAAAHDAGGSGRIGK